MISVYTASTPVPRVNGPRRKRLTERLDGGGQQDGHDQQEQDFLHLP